MATATPPRKYTPADLHQRVLHPLESLRGYIRTYVSLEGAAVLLLYLALWFWIGLILDYGFFKLFTVDWVQEFTALGSVGMGLRIGLLAILVAGLLAVVVVKVVLRLVREFRDSALALVLERRFPRQLGDRLITAVEMADPRLAQKYGYSQQMIDHTIQDAAERVDQIPVKEAFNWKRLHQYGFLVLGLTVGLYVLAAIGYCLINWTGRWGGFVHQFNDVAVIWFERNILLAPTIWPRKAHLELVDFPASGELYVGRNVASAPLKVRALKWVLADLHAPEGWRALRWSDLGTRRVAVTGPALPADWKPRNSETGFTVDEIEYRQADKPIIRTAKANEGTGARWLIADPTDPDNFRPLRWADLTPELLGRELPKLPDSWKPKDTQQGLTIDEVEQGFLQKQVREAMDADTLLALEDVYARIKTLAAIPETFRHLEKLAAQPRMSRTLRQLKIPETVIVYFKGANTRSDMTLKKGDNNEFSGLYSDLKESVRFTVCGEDYYTPSKRIEVVAPPTLVRLVRNEYEPAYIHYRAPLGGDLQELKGKKQRNLNVPFSLSGAASTVKVPAGTDLELFAEADKPLLDNVRILPREGKDGAGRTLPPALAKARVKLDANQTTFSTRFDDVRGRLEFDFEFTDTHGVSGRRQVVIEAVEDDVPKVEVEVEVIRKTNQGYMITPVARVPFKGNVSDDRGIEKIEYAYTLTRLESQAANRLRAAMVTGAVQFAPHGPNPNLLLSPFYFRVVSQLIERASAEEDQDPTVVPVGTFAQRLARLRSIRTENLTVDELNDKLKQQPTRKFLPLKQHDLLPDDEAFDLTQHLQKLKPIDKEIQPHYQLRIWLVATDNNVENPKGPRTGISKERFTFIVVSEAELLAEIFKEEENLHVKLEDTVNRLKDGNLKLEELSLQLNKGANAEQMQGAMSVRSQEILDTILKAEDVTREIHFDYSRILKELIANRVQANDKVGRVREDIVNPLDVALRGSFGSASEAQKAFYESLKAGKPDMKTTETASRQLDALIAELNTVLERMADVTTFQKVLVDLQKIEREQRGLSDALKKIHDELERIILQDLK